MEDCRRGGAGSPVYRFRRHSPSETRTFPARALGREPRRISATNPRRSWPERRTSFLDQSILEARAHPTCRLARSRPLRRLATHRLDLAKGATVNGLSRPLGRLAQRESTPFTREGSQVRSLHRPPFTPSAINGFVRIGKPLCGQNPPAPAMRTTLYAAPISEAVVPDHACSLRVVCPEATAMPWKP